MPVLNSGVTWVDLRQASIWLGLSEALDDLGLSGHLVIVDAGGGTGGFAVPLAERGHDVTVVDPSPDALASLGRRAAERGVAHLVHGRQGDLASLLDAVPPGSADVVLCHNVLEYVDAPAEALAVAASALRPGGLLSVLAANRAAAVLAKALGGRFTDAAATLEGGLRTGSGGGTGDPVSSTGPGGHDGPARRFDVAGLTALVGGAGLDVLAVHGVRVFADLVPSALAESDPAAAQALLRLQLAASRTHPYVDIATQVHVLAARREPPGKPAP